MVHECSNTQGNRVFKSHRILVFLSALDGKIIAGRGWKSEAGICKKTCPYLGGIAYHF